ncbi:MAG TPA: diguanylate cyclase [Gammaproteobacteria bacterium]|jgi:diguanylate cyclase (GGDEF)-like protein
MLRVLKKPLGKLLLLGAALICALPVLALEPGKDFHDYAADTWSVEQGLPQITVLSMVQDPQGYMWFGTQDGLARFDGVTFNQYLPAHWVQALSVDQDGTLWFGMNKGAGYFAKGDVHALGRARGEKKDVNPDSDMRALLSVDGRLLAATDAGLMRLDRDGIHREHSLPALPLFSLLQWHGALWAGGIGKLYRITNSGVQALDAPEGAGTQITHLTVHDDALWAGTSRGLFRLTGQGGWTRAANDPAELRLAVNTFYGDSDGNFWVSTNAGLARLSGDSMQQFFSSRDHEAVAQLESIYEDREHDLWLGSHAHGVTRLWNGYTRRYGADQGLGEQLVWAVTPNLSAGHSGLWVGTANGVYLLKGDAAKLVVPGSALPEPTGYVLMDDGAKLWIGTHSGLVQFADGRVSRPAALAPLDGISISGLLQAHDGTVWIATLDGVFHYADGALTRYGMDSGFKDVRSRMLFETHDGKLLVGTLAGLYQFDGTRFQPLGGDAGLVQFVTTVAEPRPGMLVVGVFDPDLLYVYLGGHWRSLHSAQGLPANVPTYMTRDGSGDWLWVGGLQGIYRVKLDELAALAGGSADHVTAQPILSEQGRWSGSEKGLCCNGAGNARGWFDGADLWYPTRGGVVSVDTRHVRFNNVVPDAVVEAVRYGGQWHDNLGETFKIPSRVRDLAFRFSVLSFQNPNSVQLSYRLQGYEDEWQNVEDLTRRVANYTNLAPGDYVFEVKGTNNAGVASGDNTSLSLRIEPYFYETWWFRVLAVLAIVLLAFLGYRLQVRNLRKQREYLEKMVAERTEALRQLNRQLEDASTTDPLTGLKNRRYLGQQLPSDLAHFRREREKPENAEHVIVFAIADVDHFKSINDRAGHFAGDSLLKQMAERLVASVRAGHYVVRWGGEEFLIVFRPMPRNEVARVVDRVHKAISERAFILPGGESLKVTCSIGYTEYPFLPGAPDRVDWELLVNLADHALYAAKDAGRDKWYGLRPGPRFDVGAVRDDLTRGIAHAIKTKKVVLVDTVEPDPAGRSKSKARG